MIEYGWARWSMDTIDDIREGEARPKSNPNLFLQSFVRNVNDLSPGCECVKISMSDSLSIELFIIVLLCLWGSVMYPRESAL